MKRKDWIFLAIGLLTPPGVATAEIRESPAVSIDRAASSAGLPSGDDADSATPAAANDPAAAAEDAEPDDGVPADVDATAAGTPGGLAGWTLDLRQTVTSDMGRFYRRQRAMRFGGVLAAAGLLANTDGDAEIQQWYRDDVATLGGDDLARDAERLGRAESIGLPLLAAGLLVGLAPEEGAAAPTAWLRRTARAYVIGTPSLLYLQTLTGGSRPVSGVGSDWQPFVGRNGVSGHAFTGAVPFLTLARQTDQWWLRVLAVAASTAGGWAQLHADQHYFSQFALGWWLAWEATDAIAESDAALLAEPRVAVTPLPVRGGGGLLVSLRF